MEHVRRFYASEKKNMEEITANMNPCFVAGHTNDWAN